MITIMMRDSCVHVARKERYSRFDSAGFMVDFECTHPTLLSCHERNNINNNRNSTSGNINNNGDVGCTVFCYWRAWLLLLDSDFGGRNERRQADSPT